MNWPKVFHSKIDGSVFFKLYTFFFHCVVVVLQAVFHAHAVLVPFVQAQEPVVGIIPYLVVPVPPAVFVRIVHPQLAVGMPPPRNPDLLPVLVMLAFFQDAGVVPLPELPTLTAIFVVSVSP